VPHYILGVGYALPMASVLKRAWDSNSYLNSLWCVSDVCTRHFAPCLWWNILYTRLVAVAVLASPTASTLLLRLHLFPLYAK
jgi:hypothetical protein